MYNDFRREQIRAERARLIKLGRIVPVFAMKPQLMVRNPDVSGGWSPEIKVVASC